MGFLKRPVEYDWTGSDVLVDICPRCSRYREVKFAFGLSGPRICTDCYNAKADAVEESSGG